MQKKWTQIQAILENSLSSGQYKVWVAPLVPAAEGDALVLFAQNNFVADFIRTRLFSIIEAAAVAVLGREFPVYIRVSPPSTSANAAKRVAHVGALSAVASAEQSNPVGFGAVSSESSVHELSAQGLVGASVAGNPVVGASVHSTALDGAVAVTPPSEQAVVGEFSVLPAPRPSPRPLPAMQFALPMNVPATSGVASRNWRYSFDDFVVGPCNELAYAASRSVCGAGKSADMLFLTSAPGLGKTHLMQAAGKALSSICNRKAPKVEYLTAEEFATRFFLAIKGSDTDKFKARYRDVDLLLLEDVHFLQGKEKMQAEFLATVQALQERGGKVICTSSFAPVDLQQMNDQLQSRLSAGLLTYIDRPDEETRKKILRHKAKIHQVLLPPDVEELLARHIHADVRRIESCLQNLVLKAQLCNSGITMQMAWEVIGNYATHTPILDIDGIIRHVCQCFGVTPDQLSSSRRKQEYVCARNTAFFLARKHTDLSLEAIGRRFNRRHSTVLKGLTNIEQEVSRQTPIGRQIANTLALIERNGNIIRNA